MQLFQTFINAKLRSKFVQSNGDVLGVKVEKKRNSIFGRISLRETKMRKKEKEKWPKHVTLWMFPLFGNPTLEKSSKNMIV